jgi:hypothetical protein
MNKYVLSKVSWGPLTLDISKDQAEVSNGFVTYFSWLSSFVFKFNKKECIKVRSKRRVFKLQHQFEI